MASISNFGPETLSMIMVTAATWGMHNDLLTACNGLIAVWCQHPLLIVMRNDHYSMMLHIGSRSY